MAEETQKTPTEELLAICRGTSPYTFSSQHKEKVQALLAAGADADNGGIGSPLRYAAHNGNLILVQMLLEAGANVLLLDSAGKTAEDLARAKSHHKVTEMLMEARRKAPDEVVLLHTAGSCIMEEVYDFPRLERVSILHTRGGGNVVSFQREKFTEIAEESSLRKAFNEHVKRGGKLTEEEVFSGMKKLKKSAPKL